LGFRIVLPVLVLLLLGLAAACGGSGDSGDSGEAAKSAPGTPGGSTAVTADARDYYDAKCARCHGPSGRGDGPMGRSLNPRDYSDPEWQATVTDEYLGQVILEGGAAHDLNRMMPAHPDLADQPEVLDGLVALIRSFSR
jgi:hypothetical protein